MCFNNAVLSLVTPSYRFFKNRVGEPVRNQDILINKQTPANTRSVITTMDVPYRNAALQYKGGKGDACVESVMLTSTPEDQMLIKVRVRSTRIPELGEKRESRK